MVLHYRLKIWRLRKKESDKSAQAWQHKTERAEQKIQHYALRYHQINNEIHALRQALEESRALNDTAKALMAQRLALLNELIADKQSNSQKNSLTNLLFSPQAFIQTIRQTLCITHPHFIRTLQESGLTDEEIGYCCLYAMGLNTKQAELYSKTSRAYRSNSLIRQKLGLKTNDTNLNLYIRNLIQQEEEHNSTSYSSKQDTQKSPN